MRHPNPDILLYIAMADAYAAAVEYLDQNLQQEDLREQALLFERYLARPKGNLAAGEYTDDTEMSIANVRVLLAHRPPYTAREFADAYVTEFRYGGMREGYASGFYRFLCKVTSGQEFQEQIQPHSTRNGAAMRAVPIGVLPSVEQVLAVARTQAQLTHDTPEGIFSAQVVALLSHYALWAARPLAEAGAWCATILSDTTDERVREHVPQIFWQPWPRMHVHTEPYGSTALTTVHAVVHLLREERSLMGMLRRVIEWGGDTDSVAAIAWGIASARYAGESLPAFMEEDLEAGNMNTSPRRLRRLGKALMDTYNM